MGWTSYYVGSGCSRKEECMKYIDGYRDKNGNPTAILIKSVMKGTSFYALMETVEKKEQFILCLLTSVSKGEFYYKDIQCNPHEWAPASLVKLFIPATEEDRKWKERMLAEDASAKKSPKFNIGDILECKNGKDSICWSDYTIKPNETFYVRIDGHNAGKRVTKHYSVVKKEKAPEGGFKYRAFFRRIQAKTFNGLAEVRLEKQA